VAELAGAFNQMVGSLDQSQAQLAQAKTETENIIRSTINSLVVTDAEGIIRSANPATEELLGYPEAELIGRPLQLLFAEGAAPVMDTAGEAPPIRNAESAYRSKHGTIIPVLFSRALMRDEHGRTHGMVCVAQDITERRHLEQLKDEFLGTVSHELRTPLTSLDGSLSLMRDGLLGPVTDEQRAHLETADRQTKRLTRLVTMLLNVSALQSGQLEIHRQAFDLAELIRQACASCQPDAGHRTLTQRLAPVPPALGDARWVLQVLEQLLRNAIQFTRDDGHIAVTAQARGGWLTVEVSDDGVGIPREMQGKLFQPFVQPGRREQERSGGSGLGLFLCKHIIERHGGTIRVEAAPGRGSTFSFTLPAAGPGTPPGG
jgi:PAS domain S-box-containing protein